MTSRFLPFLIVCCTIWAAGCHKEPEVAKQKPDTEADKPRTQSSFYQQLDPAKLKDKYASHFSSVQTSSAQSVGFGNELTKGFELMGRITKEDFQKLVESVQADLLQLAQASGATVTSKHGVDLKDQPRWLLGWYFPYQAPENVRGWSFTYSQGSTQGAVKVFWQPMEDRHPKWRLIVVLHE